MMVPLLRRMSPQLDPFETLCLSRPSGAHVEGYNFDSSSCKGGRGPVSGARPPGQARTLPLAGRHRDVARCRLLAQRRHDGARL